MLPLQDSSGLHQAPCVRPASSSPSPGPQPRTQALQTGEGHTPQLGPVFLSSRLFCSFAALPAPACGDVAGQELGSLSVPPCSRPRPRVREPGLSAAEPGPSQSHPSASASGSWGDPWGKRCALPAATEPTRRGPAGGVARPHRTLSWARALRMAS